MAKDAWNPKQYEKFKGEREQPFYDLMTLLEPSKNPMVMDLGCGTGELTAHLHKTLSANSTIGVDSSDEMLKKAQTFGGQGLRFEKDDIQTWKSLSGYDIVFSNAAIQWCTNHENIFSNIKMSLRSGGQLAIQMPMNFDYPANALAAEMSHEEPWSSLLKGQSYNPQMSMLNPEEYSRILFKLGFKAQKVLLRVYGHILDSREGVIEWVKGTTLNHFKSRLTKKDYETFLNDYQKRVFAKLPDDKPFFYPFKRIFIWGKI